jgi:hypothetical protein
MNFIEAKKKLEVYSDGKYHHLEYKITDTGDDSNNELIQECSLYIDGITKIFSGDTWEIAFKKLEQFINPFVVEIDPIEEMKND